MYLDISSQAAAMPDINASESYAVSQPVVESVRSVARAGILYASVRKGGGFNAVAYRPTNILDAVQTDHLDIRVAAAARRIDVRRLSAAP